jgi:hypothetical protein
MNVPTEPLIFLSWTHEKGLARAQALHDFLTSIDKDLVCFLSSLSIRFGQEWRDKVFSAMRKSKAIVLCISQHAPPSEWMFFEAGAIFGVNTETKIIPVIWDSECELQEPLKSFQAVGLYGSDYKKLRADCLSLVEDLCQLLPEHRRPSRLTAQFDAFWPAFAETLAVFATERPEPANPNLESELALLRRQMVDGFRELHSAFQTNAPPSLPSLDQIKVISQQSRDLIYREMGYAFSENRLEEVILLSQDLEHLDPASLKPFIERGRALRRLHRLSEAIACLKNAHIESRAADSRTAVGFWNLGCYLARLSLDPSTPTSQTNSLRAEAISMFRAAIAQVPGYIEDLDTDEDLEILREEPILWADFKSQIRR